MPVGRHAIGIRMLGKMPFVRTEGINPSAHCNGVVGENSKKHNFKIDALDQYLEGQSSQFAWNF
jgi:hypothetical protein